MTLSIAHLDYETLEAALSAEDWRRADEVTLQIMLEAAECQEQGWLDQTAIAQLPCRVLHQLDQRWLRYSGDHFGFSTQLAIYAQETTRTGFTFAQAADWTLIDWQPAGFFKFYNWLEFSLEAPPGHLPALWFWKLPWYQSLRMGGIGTGRGVGFGDASLFDALMLRLERCQQI